MFKITVQGRGFPSPTTAVTTGPSGINLRVDDERNAESWVQIFIPAETLAMLADLVEKGINHAEEVKQ